jgi:helicase MOV-10
VLVGDFILVSLSESAATLNTRKWYEGRVHQVHENHVSLRFGNDFSTYRGTKFDVRFVLNRLPYRRMHQAMSNKFKPARLLFPAPTHIVGVQRVSQRMVDDISPIYRPIGEDAEQMETVAAIVNQKPGSAPFVVFGPYVRTCPPFWLVLFSFSLLGPELARLSRLSKPCCSF